MGYLWNSTTEWRESGDHRGDTRISLKILSKIEDFGGIEVPPSAIQRLAREALAEAQIIFSCASRAGLVTLLLCLTPLAKIVS